MTAAKKSEDKPSGKVAYFNRELSWLAFNRRVLEQAQSDDFPLLERLRFLSFVSSNLDEFYEIRVAGLMQQVDSGIHEVSADGLGPREQLRRIHSITATLVKDQYRCWNKAIIPGLKKENVFFKTTKDLSKQELDWVKEFYENQIYPVLTPLAIDPAHPFPQFTNKALYILVSLENPRSKENKHTMAVIPVPRILPRVIQIKAAPAEKPAYIFLSDILGLFANRLFPGYKVLGTWDFRITRNSDLYIDEEETENLLQEIEEELLNMRKGAAVRLEIRKGVDESLLEQLLQSIHLTQEYVFRVDGPPNLMRLMSVYDIINRPDLKFKAFIPHTPPKLSEPKALFEIISKEDILLHHPYDSFTPVVDFVQQAAHDPQVFAIKQTLYRTSGDSPIIAALSEASQNGKQVTALIELKARFDEANNIEWARKLEDVGVHVVYGLVGLKTHCKCCLVVRQEKGGLKRYVHLGTGNYNPKTAKSYTDISLFTAQKSITEEVADLFNTLTGYAHAPNFQKLLVSPFNLHKAILEKIKREIEHAKSGKPARIFAKVNSLIDREIIDLLYLASQSGVSIFLLVRGICGLVPGVPGLSDNITVRSILGRFLEHSRIYYFENAGHESELFAGSADWMPRNFFRRIEAVFPIENKELKDKFIHLWIPAFMKDTSSAKELDLNGSYINPNPEETTDKISAQAYFMRLSEEARQIYKT
ncbi:MAG: polyphosphate kinase 1 [Opitutales bacterium]|tara:strand:- start:384 stop:2492 length:2109 start_codon:yes stop_codon:yes gene_type:complete